MKPVSYQLLLRVLRRLRMAALVALVAGSALAQEGVEDVFGELGQGEAAADEPATPARRPGEGTLRGNVLDAESGEPVRGATVVLMGAESGDGDAAWQEVAVTDVDGFYQFASVPPGRYRLSFVKSGFRASTMTDLAVVADEINEASFPLPPLPTESSDQVLELDAFVVEASTVGDMMDDLILRMDSDQLLNIMSAEELSKFAAGDVADALKRVAGVNIVEGQFAIIRGLEDRYSSTLYNSAPVPSPDPDSQSVQLDLFPSDIVSNLVVVKTFGGDLPGNSSGGSIDIVTHDYPAEFEFRFGAGTGFNDGARDRFLDFSRRNPVGSETSGSDIVESDFSGSMGGRLELFGREVRLNALLSEEVDFGTREGTQESRQPRIFNSRFELAPLAFSTQQSGGLAFGELGLSGGLFELTESERTQQSTSYVGLGFDLDREGNHRIDGSLFVTRKQAETIQLKENGYFPNYDYRLIARASSPEPRRYRNFATEGSWLTDVDRDEGTGAAYWFTNFAESKSFRTERDLEVYQLNGEHFFDAVEGLSLSWAANHSATTQQEDSRGTRFFYEPRNGNQEIDLSRIPLLPEELGPGTFASRSDVTLSINDIDEEQDFFRLDLGYDLEISPEVLVELRAGTWYESAERHVDSLFLESARLPGSGSSSEFVIEGDTPEEMGDRIFDALLTRPDGLPDGTRDTVSDAERQIIAWNGGIKATLWERLDLLANLRYERILIRSNNDPFTGACNLGAPRIFPTRYLFFDRLDNRSKRVDPDAPCGSPNGFVEEITSDLPPGTVFNDDVLDIGSPVDPVTGLVDFPDEASIRAAVNGEIRERRALPAYGLTFRPFEGLVLRTAYSRTVARPSFREIGYYVTVEPGSDDLVVGNPQLQLSDVESWDARIEYTWGAFGDLFAMSVFDKQIEKPIESIVVRDPLNFENSSQALYRTFFNNGNEATLRGFEVEASKNLGFLGEFFEYLTVSANYTYIDAEVGRSAQEIARAEPFFRINRDVDDPGDARFKLRSKRRLFGQPEWIANADVTFDHPGWGTRITLAFLSISDVLDAAGSANLLPSGDIFAFTLDEYIDSFHQLDLIASQEWDLEFFPGSVKLKLSIKNLTDSERRIIYDPEQTRRTVAERSYRVGADYSLSMTYSVLF